MSAFPDFDIEAAARRINEENRLEDTRTEARRLLAREEGRRLAGMLRGKDSSIRAIWGFGSAFEPSRPFRMDSDIDLAIEGGDLIKLLPIAEASSFKVDLIDLTGCGDEFARLVREHGESL
jgi:hypothetical protein